MAEVFEDAESVMAHLRALRQELLTTGIEPKGDQLRSGLTGPQVSVVRSLVAEGPATVTELARRLNLSHSTTSGIVDRLQARGLVERETDPKDRRRTLIEVSAPVQGYTRELMEGPYGRLTRVLAEATAQERRTVLDGLEMLRALLTR